MILDALKYLIGIAQDAAEPKLLREEERWANYSVQGEIKMIAKAPPAVNHLVYSLDDLVAAVVAFAAYHGPGGSVWHARDQVIGVLDNTDRRDVVRFPLTYSEAFAALVGLDDGTGSALMAQGEFLEMLQLLGVDKGFIAPFRRLDWKRQIESSGEVAHGKDRMGREITSQVAGTAGLPEDLLVHAPVYREKGEGEAAIVRCFIRLYPTHERVALRPVPGEIDTAVECAQASIRARLEDALPEGTPIFYGSP